MTVAADDKTRALPQRTSIDAKDKWDLSVLFKSDQDWETAFKQAQTLVDKAAGFTGKLGSSADVLYDCLTSRTGLHQTISDLYQYAKLSQDLDNRVSRYQAMTERAAMLSSQAHAAYAFAEPELLTLSDERLTQLAGQFTRTDIYDFYIRELIRSRAHIRSTEVEELLAQSAMVARGPDSAFTMLDNADIKYPAIKDEAGCEVQLTKQRYAKFLESSDQRVRRDAHEAFTSVYQDHANTFGALLSTEVNKNIFFARARRYNGTLHSALDGNNIPLSVYHALLEATEADLKGLHDWIALRRKILALDKIHPYDMFCPLFPDQNYDVPYDQAVEETLEAIAPLGERYRATLTSGFAGRWVDVYETEGKAGGAYSWGSFSTHPFVLMNYNDTIDNMFTLAHEMGHAMHSFLSNKTQPYPKSQYSIFVAEVASTLNENLLLQYLLKKATDKKQKRFLLNRHIDNTVGTFFHQVLYARFELTVHEMVEKGEALSPDTLSELWDRLTRQYYGPAITMDELTRYKWARIPHFYSEFYVYQYATSYAASQALLDKFLAGEPGIVDKFLELLSSGGSDYPINQLKKCGIDMTTPDPVRATLKLFTRQVEEVKRLTA